ncbi:MAG TPA: hypothetical protein VHK88_14800 [Aquihabitans sp.]|nr:hypothetical protein [Aquihabitans sp.]
MRTTRRRAARWLDRAPAGPDPLTWAATTARHPVPAAASRPGASRGRR